MSDAADTIRAQKLPLAIGHAICDHVEAHVLRAGASHTHHRTGTHA